MISGLYVNEVGWGYFLERERYYIDMSSNRLSHNVSICRLDFVTAFAAVRVTVCVQSALSKLL